jgi:uncharacterized repeat protein (TIGR01451 family)
MTAQSISDGLRRARILAVTLLWLVPGLCALAAGPQVQGQNKGDTNTWYGVNLQGWVELDYIPCRIYFGANSAGTNVVTVSFPHLSGSIPGFEDLTGFTCFTTNTTFVSPPQLIVNPSGVWAYTFTVFVSDNNPAEVRFFARLAAGAHLNGGSSLQLKSGSSGLQVHKPGIGPGAPDLAILKTGPATTSPGAVITYTLTYTNKASTNTAVGTQISDILPPELTVNTTSLTANAHLVGNTLFYDLTNVAPHATGVVTFQAAVDPAALSGDVITNFGQILSSENDANMADNSSIWLTTVIISCTPPTITGNPSNATQCVGNAVTFYAAASGTPDLKYQWRKNGSAIATATGTSYTITAVSAGDAGSYDVQVTNQCGSTISGAATLNVNALTGASTPTDLVNCPGDSAIFSTKASGTGPFSYVWRKDGIALGQTNSSLVIPAVSASDAGVYSVEVTGGCGSVTNGATLTVNTRVTTSPLTNSVNCPGDSFTCSTTPAGTGPFAFVWRKDGLLQGSTNNSLAVAAVGPSDAGTYSVEVYGACGSATNSATLIVNQNVLVSSAPVSITNCPGTPASFNVSASGTGLTYQWFKVASALSGQTASSFSIASVGANDAATYSVVVSGACGNSITNSAILTVNQSVLVGSAPASITNCPGTPASFSVSASGTGLTYQWFKGASALSGQTATSFSIGSVSANDAGTYSVVVSGTCGTSITNSATLTVNQNVLVSSVPVSITNCPGTPASFSVSANGTGLTYQWFKGAGALSGQTASSFSIASVSANDAGTYSVVVSGTCGNSITNSATLTVNQNVLVSSVPVSITNCPGSPASFSVSASGTGLTYQWFKGLSALSGQTASSFSIANVTANDAGTYSVVVSGTCGNSITNSATLTVNQNAMVAAAPVSITNCPGTPASFSVTATGTGLTYQWFKGASALSGQTSSSYSIANVSAGDAATYSVLVSGNCGSSISNSASLTVNQNVLVASSPVSITNCPGTPASFSVSATGTGLTYQWFKGAGALSGQTGSSYSLASVGASDAGTYSVVVTGTCGGSISNSATLTVNENVLVGSAPVSTTNCPGTTASFNVTASGTGLTYRWFKDTTALPGATASSYFIASVSAGKAGTYSVVVTGSCGNPITNSATLTVNQNVLVSAAPVSITNCPGTPASFSVSATGTGLTYQWFKGAGALSGQTSSSFSIGSVSANDTGTYSVVVSGTCGNSITNSATLTVNQNVLVNSAPVSITNCSGTPASFSVSASGTGLTYQWFKGTGALLGQTATSFSIASVSANDAGTYSVVVSGTCGSSITKSATLTVNQNVLVSSAPVSITNCPGNPASFGVSATGTGLTYQWFKGASALSGQTASSFSIASVSANNAGTYSVVVSGTCGNSITNSATLTVNQNVLVSSAPVSITNCPGTPASFSVSASGTGITYQWFKGAGALSGQTATSFSIASVSANDAGAYSVVVSGTCGSSITNSATLTVNQNVLVSAAPVSITNCPGTPASFSVSAAGTGLTYQWFKGAGALSGQTASSFSIGSVSANDAGTYSVVVSGTCGNSITNSATLTVNQNVLVSSAPVSITNCPGTPASFSVSATGTGLTYQWFKGVSALSGQTSSSFSIGSVSANDTGVYSVMVSGTCGNSITNSTTLTVNQNVLVSAAPASITNCPGTPASFSVSATGTGLTYQWFKGAGALSGQTSSSFSIGSVSANDTGTYSVVVSGTCGNSITNSATLTVNQNVLVSSAPVSITNCPGTPASFSVSASGTGLTYQWFKGVSALSGQTTSSFSIANVTANNAGTYSVVVSGTCGNSITNSATLTVNQNMLVSAAPVSITNCPGAPASFSVSATGTGLTYQWFKGASALSGQTASSFSIASVSANDAGTYSVVVSGTCGNSITNSATLTVNQNIQVSTAPVSITNCPGTPASFSVSASGTGLTYQWFKGTGALSGQTTSSYSIGSVGASNAGSYSVVVSGTCGSSITNSVTLTVNQNVLVAAAPVSITNCPGTPASFSVSASGSGLTYQWFKGTSVLSGQTGSSYSIATVSGSDAATYSVVVSGACGNSITNSATLTVNQNVLVTSAPVNITNCPGTPASFSVSATGTGLTYQWFKGAGALSGQTSSSYSIASISASDAATYSVVVSGACGAPVSKTATLTINQTISTTPLANLTLCPGQSGTFSSTPSGSGSFSFVWKRNGTILASQTTSSLSLSNVTASASGTYSLTISGSCGSVTVSANLTVNTLASAGTMNNQVKNPGETATFSTIAFGSGQLSYVWAKNGTVLQGQTSSSLTLSNVSYADAGIYTVQVSGTCNTVTQSASLIINLPPTVSIATPQDGATFVLPQAVPILANASDPDGTIAKVELYAGTNKLAELGSSPYYFFWTNVPVGSYQLTARATDNMGLSATSSVVNITVLDHPPIAGGPATLNRQNGLFEQSVTITNPTPYTFTSVRVWIEDLAPLVYVFNATGTNGGIPYIDYLLPIAGGATGSFVIEYYVASRIPPTPTLVPQVLGADYGSAKLPPSAPVIDACQHMTDGTFQISFFASAGYNYSIQYCSSLGGTWKTSPQAIAGAGSQVHWTDSGPPLTDSPPSTQATRFYRIMIVAP